MYNEFTIYLYCSEEILGKAAAGCTVQGGNANWLRKSMHLCWPLRIHLEILFMTDYVIKFCTLEGRDIIHLRKEHPDCQALAPVWLITYRKEQVESCTRPSPTKPFLLLSFLLQCCIVKIDLLVKKNQVLYCKYFTASSHNNLSQCLSHNLF